jgi:hypothetical protein
MIKKIALIISIFLSLPSIAQSPNSDHENKTFLPIKTTGKTDPNYEKNLAKNKEDKAYFKKEQMVAIKNKIYYQNLILKLKENNAKREKTENKNDDIELGKIRRLKAELLLTEEHLKKNNRRKITHEILK